MQSMKAKNDDKVWPKKNEFPFRIQLEFQLNKYYKFPPWNIHNVHIKYTEKPIKLFVSL